MSLLTGNPIDQTLIQLAPNETSGIPMQFQKQLQSDFAIIAKGYGSNILNLSVILEGGIH